MILYIPVLMLFGHCAPNTIQQISHYICVKFQANCIIFATAISPHIDRQEYDHQKHFEPHIGPGPTSG